MQFVTKRSDKHIISEIEIYIPRADATAIHQRISLYFAQIILFAKLITLT